MIIVKKILRDPFIMLIALVVVVPAGFMALSIVQQNRSQATSAAAGQASQVVSTGEDAVAGEAASPAAANPGPEPIPPAEQPAAVLAEKTTVSPAAPTCNQAKKQEAIAIRDNQVRDENHRYQKTKSRLRLISLIDRRRLDSENARHDDALRKIEAQYQAALKAAYC